MNITIAPRGSGRTTRLIKKALLENCALLVLTESEKKFINNRLIRAGYREDFVDILTVKDIERGIHGAARNKKLLIDNAGQVIPCILESYLKDHGYDGSVDIAVFSTEDVSYTPRRGFRKETDLIDI